MKQSTIVATAAGFLLTAALGFIWNSVVDSRDKCTALCVEMHIAQEDVKCLEAKIDRLLDRHP